MLLHVPVRLRLLTMSKLWLLLLLIISHLTQNIQTVSGHQVFLVVDTVICPLISLRRGWFVPVPTLPRDTKVSNATMAVATLGAARGSAAGRQVSNRVPEVVSRGSEVLLEVVQAVTVVKAVVVSHQRLQPTGILQSVPEAPTKFFRKSKAI